MSNGRANILQVSEPEEGLIEHAKDIKPNTYKRQQDSIDAFRIVKKLELDPSQPVKFTHDIFMARRQIDGVEAAENHFIKSIEEEGLTPAANKVEARIEVLGLRYSRLGDLNQPCSRYVLDTDKKKHLVSSIEIAGFRAFSTIPEDEIRENILNNVFKGAGGKFFWRWALDDHDFNTSNGGVDQNNNVIILDCGWYFGIRYKKYANKITAKDFQNFPWVTDFQPKSFLDHVRTFCNKQTNKEYTRTGEGKILSKEMITNLQIRHDFFEAALQFIVMPDLFTTQFAFMHIADSGMISACDAAVQVIEDYIQPELARQPLQNAKIKEEEEKGNYFANQAILMGKHILDRKLQMRAVALQNQEFVNYLKSPQQAAQDLEKFIASLEQYEIVEQDPIFTYVPNLKESIQTIFTGMQLVNQESQILCQRIMRLTDPAQPNTLFTQDEKGNPALALAENTGVRLFSEMNPQEINQNIISGRFKGAGAVFFWRWALDSYEFDLQHVGVDATGKVLSLEAGLYLGKSVRYYHNKITQQDFDQFPLLEDFDPKVFLDYIHYSKNPDTGMIVKKKGQGGIITSKLIHHPQFQHEYYEAVLQFILMPDAFFYAESQTIYQNVAAEVANRLGVKTDPKKIEEMAKDRAEKVILRRNQMQAVALQSKKFLFYLKNETARNDLEVYINAIKQFAVLADGQVLPEFIEHIKNAFINLRLFHNKELKPNRDILATSIMNFERLCRRPLETLHEEQEEDEEEEKEIKIEAKREEQEEKRYHEEKKEERIQDELPSVLPLIAEDKKPNDRLIEEAIAPVIKAPKPTENFAWGALIKGVLGTFMTGGMVVAGLMAYGAVTVATFGANLGLTIALSASLCALGGLTTVLLADTLPEIDEQPKAIEEQAKVLGNADDKQEEPVHAVMCPPLVPFYRAESSSSPPIDLVGVKEVTGVIITHVIATEQVKQEDLQRKRVESNPNKYAGLPSVVVAPPPSDLSWTGHPDRAIKELRSIRVRI